MNYINYIKYMKYTKINRNSGYSLFELLLVVMIIGIIATVSLRTMNQTYDVVKVEESKIEMNQLAYAIAGNDELISGGQRTDFGYVGDIGSMPPNLSALVVNPGGFSTWSGPYINDKYYASIGGSESEYAQDGFGSNYIYSGGNTIVSSGGSSNLTREIVNSVDDLLYNRLNFVLTDLDLTPPGVIYKDSIKLLLTYPNGVGGLSSDQKFPSSNGLVTFDSIPIGQHNLKIIYIPGNDTLKREIIVNQGETKYLDLSWYEDVW